jgi:phosphoadenosine phosphosulfate reductase
MYSYNWDPETGGFLLNSSPLKFSKEPRPVYYKELDILGFDKYWKYEKNDSFPYMWAEENNYIYRGRRVAKTKGGSVYTAPELIILEEPEPNNSPLRFVDIPAMVAKNQEIIDALAQDTIKNIYNTYIKYLKSVDVFYVAFSGGKDSVVTLDLVQRALPHNKFKVLFGDTGMEFPDTYKEISRIEDYCKTNSIEFVRAKSHFTPEASWEIFGPPATVTRWCCSVHKTVPQIITLRELTGKPNFTGMAFIGIRGSESLSRSDYDYVSIGEKHKGQYSCNPILDWNSAELYTYIYSRDIPLNEAYKKGNRRAGCLVCPRAAERNEYMARACYKREFDDLLNLVKNVYSKTYSSEAKLHEFIGNGGWKARKNGRDLDIQLNYSESLRNGTNIIKINHPNTDWHEWIKTIGILLNDSSPYRISFKNEIYEFQVYEQNGCLEVRYDEETRKKNPLFIKLLKEVFRRAACCVQCRECEADCHWGCISMCDGKVKISDNCKHCFECHKVEKGCLVYKSLEMPNGGLKMSKSKSLNCYSHHAPKMEWIKEYFTYKNTFDENNTLGSQMYSFFKRFLRDAELLDNNGFSKTAEVIDSIGIDEEKAWALMLVNLSYTPQINWLVKRLNMNETYKRDYVLSLLEQDGAKESWVKDVWSSFGRFADLPFQNVGFGSAIKEKNRFLAITRTPWRNPDPTVILYSLYKFAESCGDYYQFTLSRLLDFSVDSDGVSPAEIFGLDKETMEKVLNGLSINYPEFITTQFTLDLDAITLNPEKSSVDVLGLF